jgi:hypothetical protein
MTSGRLLSRAVWPDGKRFAFTVFDDPDAQSCEVGRRVYGFLGDLGFRTTRGVWPGRVVRPRNSGGETCENAEYRRHTMELQDAGFEVGYHHTAPHSSTREEIRRGLVAFEEYFGHAPVSMANHYNAEAIYWGGARLDRGLRALYTAATLGRTTGRFFGHEPGHESFWGDICRNEIRYCRNFVYAGVNTFAACPWMPYHDPRRPFVNRWYASTEGSNVARFTAALGDAEQDRLEAEGGACIMYTHFGHGFVDGGRLHPAFERLMTRLSRKDGWFVPVATLLDYLAGLQSDSVISDRARGALERRWLWEKTFRGTS